MVETSESCHCENCLRKVSQHHFIKGTQIRFTSFEEMLYYNLILNPLCHDNHPGSHLVNHHKTSSNLVLAVLVSSRYHISPSDYYQFFFFFLSVSLLSLDTKSTLLGKYYGFGCKLYFW